MNNRVGSSGMPVRNSLDPEPPSLDPPAKDREFEPQFIDVTEDDHVLIITGVLDDKNTESKRPEN